MKPFPKRAMTALAAALVLAACAKTPATDADAKAEGETAANTLKIPGLKDEKAQVSYVLGVTLGKQMSDIKDEVDLATVTRGMRDELNGGKVLVSEEQATQIMAQFMERMQVRMAAQHAEKARESLEAGNKFLAENGKKEGVKTTESGLQYQVITEGKGPKPGAKDAVRVKYTGSLLDGTVFDSTDQRGGEPATLPLEAVIPGWAEGLRLMPVGSKYKLWIPGNIAYGEQVPPGAPFPPNATLVFDVELVEIVKQ